MGGVPGKHPAQVLLAENQQPIGDLGSEVNTKRSAKQFARGHRGGTLTILIFASARTASNDAANRCHEKDRIERRRELMP
jgi:hypothetical protein